MNDSPMADQRMTEMSRARPACPLCAYTGGAHAVFDEIMAYVADNSQRVHLNELACVFITAVPNTKLCAWGEEDSGGHVL
jgi:hypothetical protein